jgi:hypothetical protein
MIIVNKLIDNILMAVEFVRQIGIYIHQVIEGFESGIYKMVSCQNSEKLMHLASKHQPFIPIFRDLHETYYTSTFNSIIKRDDKYVTDTFDNFQKLSNHSKQCMLNVLANLIVSIHFNLDRKNLQYKEYDTYMSSLRKTIDDVITVVDIQEMFNHECSGPKDSDLQLLSDGEKFITIKMSYKSNNIEKEINSFIPSNPDPQEN